VLADRGLGVAIRTTPSGDPSLGGKSKQSTFPVMGSRYLVLFAQRPIRRTRAFTAMSPTHMSSKASDRYHGTGEPKTFTSE